MIACDESNPEVSSDDESVVATPSRQRRSTRLQTASAQAQVPAQEEDEMDVEELPATHNTQMKCAANVYVE
jgi:hypothetical protein